MEMIFPNSDDLYDVNVDECMYGCLRHCSRLACNGLCMDCSSLGICIIDINPCLINCVCGING